MKKAMFAKNELRLNTLRGLIAAFTNELVATRRKPTEEFPDDDALEVIRRGVKQRKDSIEQFGAGGRQDLVKQEEAEMKILLEFLPAAMPEEEIRKLAETKKAELGITDKSKMGMLIGTVMKELKGRADGAEVKKVVENLFRDA